MMDFYHTLQTYREFLGKDLFDFIKLWEPYVIGMICSDDIEDLLQNTIKDLNKSDDYGGIKNKIQLFLTRFLITSCSEIFNVLPDFQLFPTGNL